MKAGHAVIPYSEADHHDAVARIYLQSRAHHFRWLDSSTYSLSDFARDTEAETIYVLETDKPVGFSSVYEVDRFLHHLYLAPGMTGRSLGMTLLSATVARYERPMHLKCLQKNTRARQFYEHNGWKIVANDMGPDGPYVTMRLD